MRLSRVLVGRLLAIVRRLVPDRVSAIESIARSIPELLWKESLARHVVSVDLIRSACVEYYLSDLEMHPFFRTEMHFARRHVYRMRDVLVHPVTGACRADDHLIQESFGSLRRCLLAQPFPSRSRPVRHEEKVATVVQSTGYGHFILEEVPRLLWVARQFPEVRVLLASSAPRFCREALELLASRGSIRGFELIDDKVMLAMTEYAFAQAEAYSGFFHSTDIGVLREGLLPRVQPSSGRSERLYLTRRQASRGFDNEIEVESALAAAGVRAVCLEDMTIGDEIQLLSRAALVVAPHGAGLANLVWCPPSARVVELFSPKLKNDCYARVCSTLGLHYTPLWATEGRGWGAVDVGALMAAVSATATNGG